MTERPINLASPLAHKATDMRTTDTTGSDLLLCIGGLAFLWLVSQDGGL